MVLYSNGYKLSDTIPLWIQQSITASYYVPKLPLILQAIMLPHYHWYLIQQSSLLPYNHWFSKLPYKLTIPNLIHYYTIIDTATLWNNTLDPTINYPNIHDSIQLSLRYDTWYNYQYTYTPFDIYPYATILDTTTSNYYDTPRIQQAFLCPYDSLDTTPTSYIL